MSAAPLCWSCASPRSSMADRPHVALVVHRRGRIVPAGCHTLLQRDGDIVGDEAVDVATEQRHLSDQTRANERVRDDVIRQTTSTSGARWWFMWAYLNSY